MPASRGMPSSVPAVWDGRWWSDSMQGVDCQWETRSTHCAVTSGTETLRPLIHVACAGSSDSSISMLLEVAARSSPAVVDGERPSRSSWCGFRSQITAADQSDECCSQSEQRKQLPGKAAEVHRVNAGAGRWAHAEGGGFQEVSARERQALARQGVAHQEGHAAGTPTAGLVEVTAANEPRRWGTLVPALLQKSHAGMVPRQSSSKGNTEGRRV
ncbi:hypothetical protein TcG_13289 [Trypanosoma cruzi]|nr:hypothetical protein TcG_13289 [Trypanosoma cruzi]